MLVTILGAANEPRVHEIAIGTNGRDVLGPADGATGRCDRTVAGAPARWLLRQLGRRGIRGEGPGDYPLVYARNLRLQLAREHVDRLDRDDANLCEPLSAFRASPARLPRWTSGMPRAGQVRGHQAGCGSTTPGTCRAGSEPGPGQSTGTSSTRTAARQR